MHLRYRQIQEQLRKEVNNIVYYRNENLNYILNQFYNIIRATQKIDIFIDINAIQVKT